jgi:transposase-like protein
VLAHKLREAVAAEQRGKTLSGEVEIDGAYFGGYIRQENRKADRKDRRLAIHQTGKRRCVVAMRERGGHTLPFVVATEDEAAPMVRKIVTAGSIVYADESSAWDVLHASYDAKRINHGLAFSDDGACTNQVESYFSRLRRAEIGQHHRISGMWLPRYAAEMAWREDTRRASNGTLCLIAAGAALGHPVSRD